MQRRTHSRYTQHLLAFGPRLGPRSVRTAEDGPKMATIWPKMVPRWPEIAPRWPQDGLRWPQDGPRWAQDGLQNH